MSQIPLKPTTRVFKCQSAMLASDFHKRTEMLQVTLEPHSKRQMPQEGGNCSSERLNNFPKLERKGLWKHSHPCYKHDFSPLTVPFNSLEIILNWILTTITKACDSRTQILLPPSANRCQVFGGETEQLIHLRNLQFRVRKAPKGHYFQTVVSCL